MTFSPEELERRRQQCLKTKPWLKSTGATSERGKAIVSQNALRTGRYSSIEPIRALARLDIENQAMEEVRTIAKKMQDAYAESDAAPHPHWSKVFENISDEDFLKKLRNFKP